MYSDRTNILVLERGKYNLAIISDNRSIILEKKSLYIMRCVYYLIHAVYNLTIQAITEISIFFQLTHV